MIRDDIFFGGISTIRGSSRKEQIASKMVQFLTNYFGANFTYDNAKFNYETTSLLDLFRLAEDLRANGVINSYRRVRGFSDEPRIAHWEVECATKGHHRAAGSTVSDEYLALTIALAEAIERYIWFEKTDYFKSLKSKTYQDLSKAEFAINPSHFAGFSEQQRISNHRLFIDENSTFLWTPGYSWVHGKKIWIPAQTVSGHSSIGNNEPLIRSKVTTGLATHFTRKGALLRGAFEVIERDAYINTWLNQLAMPRFDLKFLALQDESLQKIISICNRYYLKPYAIRLMTDAPTYAVCAVLEDTTGNTPRFSFGLKTNMNAAYAVERAIMEALRARIGVRRKNIEKWDKNKAVSDIIQYERLYYWADKENSNKLEFFISNSLEEQFSEMWDNDTEEMHFERIVHWCRKEGYEFASVDFTSSSANLSGWNIEMVVMPELQPLHYFEKLPHIGGNRLKTVPKKFGYIAREPYLDAPHPFA